VKNKRMVQIEDYESLVGAANRSKYMLKARDRSLKWSDIKMTEMDLDKLVLHFSQCMRAEGKSPKTISWYGEMIGAFIRFLKNSGRASILAEFNLEIAREFVVNGLFYLLLCVFCLFLRHYRQTFDRTSPNPHETC
jgi:hypothetical protein